MLARFAEEGWKNQTLDVAPEARRCAVGSTTGSWGLARRGRVDPVQGLLALDAGWRRGRAGQALVVVVVFGDGSPLLPRAAWYSPVAYVVVLEAAVYCPFDSRSSAARWLRLAPMNSLPGGAHSCEEYGQRLYRHYAQRPLAEHIATGHAIGGLAHWLLARSPSRILEIGAGIGTLTHCLLEVGSLLEEPAQVHSVEPHLPCSAQLAINLEPVLAATRCSFALHRGLETIELGPAFDFLVIDGGDEATMAMVDHLRRAGTVFVEGDRRPQRESLRRAAAGRQMIAHQFISRRLRPTRVAHAEQPAFDGGFTIVRFEPTLFERLDFVFQRLHTAWVRRWVRPRVLRAHGLSASHG